MHRSPPRRPEWAQFLAAGWSFWGAGIGEGRGDISGGRIEAEPWGWHHLLLFPRKGQVPCRLLGACLGGGGGGVQVCPGTADYSQLVLARLAPGAAFLRA